MVYPATIAGSGQVYIGAVWGIESHQNPDDGDRDGSQNIDTADGPKGFY
jgi:hypothetical protein